MRPQPSSNLLFQLISPYNTHLCSDQHSLLLLRTCSPSPSPSPTTFSILPTAKSNFSTTRAIPFSNDSGSLQAPTNNQTQRKHFKDDTKGNAEIPTVSLEGLGLSRNMKMVVRAMTGVIGTTETLFWCRSAWR
ncbi:hypothetical protein PABG_02642 [Paracoccidioides brasiliensis Pb03]|uniref:Uncharacterized protein n=1 Tax=Paracoccidioides brasiliensis (strain Pb18) TaxID=502780 RepID=C1FZ54_PARBD|nr:uncharacterized protein PADG_01080 [Paracoccidioides brasiliensis Pb18]EEH20383.1 hypothetical protein PABG_02642 [Paracoccidioides brasiliensis Pb03]EEH44791.1 hypothetical protein PADG_01080 [Paracoccidioides brasiliensis Pb18]